MTTAIDTLRRTWSPPAGIVGWLSQVNHRAIGVRFIVTAFFFFGTAGLMAMVMRTQLAWSNLALLSPEAYNQLMTLHGSLMMFLFSVPVMEGIAIYLVPLMIGARDMAFPRLNAFGYWVFVLAGVTLLFSFVIGAAPNGGWFNYVPLTGPEYSPGVNIDYWVTAITFLEISALVAAVELIVTILKNRTPGMSISRMPLFVWAILVMSFMILFAMPPLMLASVMLGLDRVLGANFFNPAAGGDPLLWQHIFWIFGHPEVYIIFVPALGIVSMLVQTFSRRRIAGYLWIVLSTVAIGFLSFGLWVHHMFASGLPWIASGFFAAASMMIGIPSGVQFFAWIATLWGGRILIRTPFLYIIGFFLIFLIGGITGIMVAAVPFDWQVHDTYFVVAHFHYVLVGGAVFPLLGGLFYWFPKITGRLLDERIGRWGFWLNFVGFNIAFLPMHLTGFLGMPRRVYTYIAGLEWEWLNLISTVGAVITAAGFALILWNVVRSVRDGQPAGDNPWQASTLEWATESPPPTYNFLKQPRIASRDPLWDGTLQEEDPLPSDLRADRRETIATRALSGEPDYRVVLPNPSLWPLALAIAVGILFLGLIIDIIFVPIGVVLTYIAVLGWLWPNREEWERGGESRATELPIHAAGSTATGWWGIVLLVLIEIVVFSTLIASYFYLKLDTASWPPAGITAPDLALPTINTFILLISLIPVFWASRGIQRGDQRRLVIGLGVAIALNVLFFGLKVYEYASLPYDWSTNAYGSITFTMTGFHLAHVLAVLLKAGPVMVLGSQGFFNARRFLAVQTTAIYWLFVALIWIPLYFTIYWAPRVL